MFELGAHPFLMVIKRREKEREGKRGKNSSCLLRTSSCPMIVINIIEGGDYFSRSILTAFDVLRMK
jgi:hypothetical protein